jgi:hypothetical protein
VGNLREPRSALAFVAGPLLGPLALLGLLPLLLQRVRGTGRRALQTAAGVLAAGIVAGVRGTALPFTSGAPPKLALHATQSPFSAASALLHALFARPELPVEALLLGAIAAALPFALKRGLAWIAGLSACLLAGLVVGAPHSSVLPLVAAAWITAIVLALQERGWRPVLGVIGAARLRFE